MLQIHAGQLQDMYCRLRHIARPQFNGTPVTGGSAREWYTLGITVSAVQTSCFQLLCLLYAVCRVARVAPSSKQELPIYSIM